MSTILGFFNASAFTIISAFHFYWAFGGKKGINIVLPELESTKKVFLPSPMMTIGVSLIFFSIAVFTLYSIGILNFYVPDFLKNYGLYCLTTIMFIRSIGDFHYAGFFKTVKNTAFAQYDTQYYSPLCLILGIFFILIQILK